MKGQAVKIFYTTAPKPIRIDFCCEGSYDMTMSKDLYISLRFKTPDPINREGRTMLFCPFCGEKIEVIPQEDTQ